MDLVSKLRLRALAWVIGAAVCAVTLISIAAIPAWPVVGVAVACVAVAINSMAARLEPGACLACGTHLGDAPRGEHGTHCPSCGAINDRGGTV